MWVHRTAKLNDFQEYLDMLMVLGNAKICMRLVIYFYVFWCGESKSSNQFGPSRTDFLIYWVILSHRVKNKVHFTVVITSKFLFQNLVNEKK